MDILVFSVLVFLAYGLDMVLGDPLGLPHPVRWIGRAITFVESILRGAHVEGRASLNPGEGARQRFLGVVLAVVIAGGVYAATWLALVSFHWVSPALYYILYIYIIWASLSVRSLGTEARLVSRAMERGEIELGRDRLSLIVGRDTVGLSEAGIYRAAAETVAENTSDGVVAPLFYLAIGGPALMLAYKAVNTLDSMTGYKNEKYRDFGWFPARLDDAANYVPARLTAALMVLASFILGYDWWGALRTLLRDGRNHSSPNAGLPEAAVAGATGVRFGGPSSYGGIPVVKPFIGDGGLEHSPASLTAAMRILSITAFAAIFLTCILRFFVYGLL
ncbi:MAG: adenosylcobinamide-phosphate synthase CbiB [Thermodesulfobacteriota bacterium]